MKRGHIPTCDTVILPAPHWLSVLHIDYTYVWHVLVQSPNKSVTVYHSFKCNQAFYALLRLRDSACVCVCLCVSADGSPLMLQSDSCSTFLIHYFPSVKSSDEDPEEEALIACTYCVNNGIVLEISPPSRLPVSHAGALSSVFAIFSHSMQLLGSPSRDATSGRKQTYLPESSWWGLVLTLTDLKINTAFVWDNCAMKR